ncbi:hypothetical protein A8B78_07090 [Jannaschia sp. EhC01]|nr:hypothetical protein A8B78_07090 [Jannaschia sp. EhC01]
MGRAPDTPERVERQLRTATAYDIGLADLLSGGDTLGGGDQSVFFMLPWLELMTRKDAAADQPPLLLRPYAEVEQRTQYALRQRVHDLEQGLSIIQEICTELESLSENDPNFEALVFAVKARPLNEIMRTGVSRSDFNANGARCIEILASLELALRSRSSVDAAHVPVGEVTRDWPLFMWGHSRLLYLKRVAGEPQRAE